MNVLIPLGTFAAISAMLAGPVNAHQADVARAADPDPPAVSTAALPYAPRAVDAAIGKQIQTARWQFTLMPYVWATGLSGTLRPIAGGPVLSISRSFSDAFEDVDAAGFISIGAQRDRVVLLGDASYVSTSREGTLPNGAPGRGATKQTTLTLAGGYRARAELPVLVDLFAGFRAFWLEADVEIAGGAISASPRRNFVDPLVGGRAILPFSPRWSTMLYTDVGGFGAGTDLTVVTSGMVNYALSPRLLASGGYRAMFLDYDDRGTVADLTMQGPVLGLSWRF
jgi:hypothetical protein